MHRILVEKSVSITELRKNPARFLCEEPVAILSNNRPAGYMMSAQTFECIVEALMERENGREIAAKFRPSSTELRDIAQRGRTLLAEATDEELSEFTE